MRSNAGAVRAAVQEGTHRVEEALAVSRPIAASSLVGAAVALAASLCAILIHVEGQVVSQTWRAGSYPGRRAICSEVTGPGSSMAERSAKITAYPVLKVFRRYASFRVALGFAQPPRQFPRIPEQRFQPPAEGLYPSSHPPFPSLKIARCAEREFLVKSSRALARGVLA